LKEKKAELKKKEVNLGVTKSDLKRTTAELEKMKSKLHGIHLFSPFYF